MRTAPAVRGTGVFFLVIFIVLSSARTYGTTPSFFVAPGGNDYGPGTIEEPFATLEAARNAVREVKNEHGLPDGGITVFLREGRYEISSSFELQQQDSGAENSPVTYKAYDGEEVRLTGGVNLDPSGFEPVTDEDILSRLPEESRDDVMQIDLSRKRLDFGTIPFTGHSLAFMPWLPRRTAAPELMFNGEIMTLARWPNEGYARIGTVIDKGSVPRDDDSPADPDYRGAVFEYEGDRPGRWQEAEDPWLFGYWYHDWSDQTIQLESIDTENQTIETRQPSGYGIREGRRYYAYNLLEELETPGEWYLNRDTGVLYFYPPSSLDDAVVQISQLTEPIVLLRNTSHVRLEGLVFEAGRHTAIAIQGGNSNLINQCTIRTIAGNAVNIQGGTDNGILSSVIHDTGSTGIIVSGGDTDELVPAGNFAENNHIHNYARLRKTYSPGITLRGAGNRASHNKIHNAPHMAIGFSGNDHLMEYNEIFDVAKETDDVGAIYSGRCWQRRGHVIRHNFFHNIHGIDGHHGAMVVYLDDGLSGMLVEGNVFYNIPRRAYMVGGGHYNTFRNNLFVECDQPVHIDARLLGWAAHMLENLEKGLEEAIERPLWRAQYPELVGILEDEPHPSVPKNNIVETNILYNSGDMYIVEEAETYGTIKNNLQTTQNPGIDPDQMDFEIEENSWVYEALPDFQPIPFNRIGLYSTEVDRVELEPAGDQLLTAGEDLEFSARAYDENDNLLSDDVRDFTWEAQGGAIEAGVFTERVAGEYEVIAVYGSVESAPVLVEVQAGAAAGFLLQGEQEGEAVELGDQTAGEPFTLHLRASDDYDNFTEDYTGEVFLTDSTATLTHGGETEPQVTVTAGEWSGPVEITRAAQEVFITARDSAEESLSGQSAVFEVFHGEVEYIGVYGFAPQGDDPVPVGDQRAGEAFGVELRAYDVHGNFASGHESATAQLSDTTGTIKEAGGAASPTVEFSGGRWSGEVLITQAMEGVVITASGQGEVSGESEPFDVHGAEYVLEVQVRGEGAVLVDGQPYSVPLHYEVEDSDAGVALDLEAAASQDRVFSRWEDGSPSSLRTVVLDRHSTEAGTKSVTAFFVTELQHAIDEASVGETIEVPPGVHSAAEPLRVHVDGITLRSSAGREETYIDAEGGDDALIIEADGVRIEGFWIGNYRGTGILIEGHDARVLGNRVDGYEQSGFAGVYVDGVSGAIIGSNVIENTDRALFIRGRAERTKIINNTLRFNDTGLENAHGNANALPARTRAVNNNIYDNLWGVDWRAGPAVEWLDATLNWWGDPEGPYPTGAGDAITYNVHYSSWVEAPVSGGASISASGTYDVDRSGGVELLEVAPAGRIDITRTEAASPSGAVPRRVEGSSYSLLRIEEKESLERVRFRMAYEELVEEKVYWYCTEEQRWMEYEDALWPEDNPFAEAGYGGYVEITVDEETSPSLTEHFGTVVFALPGEKGVVSQLRGSEDCFIATAAFGSVDSAVVEVLREFRDSYLLTSGAGLRLTRAYYRHSPALAALIARRPVLRAAAALALLPLGAAACLMLNMHLWAPLLVFAFLSIIMLWINRKPEKLKLK